MYISKSKDLIVQFTLNLQSSQTRVCFVQPLLNRACIDAILIILIKPRVWTYFGSLQLGELFILQYGSFSALGKWVKQVTLRTGCFKWVTDWTLKWQLYLNELAKDYPWWSIAWQEWGLFLLKGLFNTTSTMLRMELQHHIWRCPHSHQTAVAEDMVPNNCLYEVCWILQMIKCWKWLKIFTVDGQYQVVPSVLPHQYQDQLMRLWRSGLHGGTGLGRSPSRGRVCSHDPQQACFSLQAWSPGTSRQEGTTVPQHQGHKTAHPIQSPSPGYWQSWQHFKVSSRAKGWVHSCSLLRHGPSEATNAKWPWMGSSMRWSQSTFRHSYGNPTQSEVQSRTPFRCVLPLPSPPHSPAHRWVASSLFQPRNPRERSSLTQEPNSKVDVVWPPKPGGSMQCTTNAYWLGQPPAMAWGCHQWVRWQADNPNGYEPSYATWDDCAKEGGWPLVLCYCR